MSIELAATATAALAPYLAEAGKEAAKTLGKESAAAGLRLLGWLREKLGGRGNEALAELEAAPESKLNQDDFRTQLAKLLEKRPELGAELRELLGEPAGGMTQVVGAGGKASQIEGHQNIVSIG